MEHAVQAIHHVSFVKFGAGRGKRQSTKDWNFWLFSF